MGSTGRSRGGARLCGGRAHGRGAPSARPGPRTMRSPHHIRSRLASEQGQATVNWLAVMVGLTVLAAALVIALPSAAPKITCSFQNVVSKVTGGAGPGCDYNAAGVEHR